MTPTDARREYPWPRLGTLDSTAQLMGRINDQLGSRLSQVARSGGHRHVPAPTFVLVGHGSRDPRTLATVQALVAAVRAYRPALPVRFGHIESDEPLLPDSLARLAPGRAVLVPLLLGRGHHVGHDLPLAAAAAPHLDTRVAAPLGPHPLLVDALYARLVEAGLPTRERLAGSARLRRDTGVVLAAAGSRDPEGLAGTRGAAAALAAHLGVPVVAAFASAAAPTVPAALRLLAARSRHRTAVAAYFTAPGRFAAQCAAVAPGVAAAPLGAHPAVVELLLRRYDDAARAYAERPAADYRPPAAG